MSKGESPKGCRGFPVEAFELPDYWRGAWHVDVIRYRAEEAPLRSYTYKVGAKGALIGVAFVAGSLALSTKLLSDDVEWHLFGAGDPFVVPTILIKLVWWACFLMGVGALLLRRLPAQSILLERDGVLVPKPGDAQIY